MALPDTWSLTARWVLPVEGPPLPGATVVIRGDRIEAVAPAGQIKADVDLGNAAILPGFTNAHTHLDLSGLHGRCPPTADFTAWLRQVIAHRRQQTPGQIESDIRTGLARSLRHGVTLLGDISAGGASWPVLAAAPVRAVVFHELLGLTEERAKLAWDSAVAWLRAHPATSTCRPGLSPHAPYSVRASLFAQVAACSPQVPVAIHVAETPAELELLRVQSGPLVGFLKEVGVWDPAGLIESVEALVGGLVDPMSPFGGEKIGAEGAPCSPLPHRGRGVGGEGGKQSLVVPPSPVPLSPGGGDGKEIPPSPPPLSSSQGEGIWPPPKLWIHGNYLDPATSGLASGTVVYCPRTHAAFGHPVHPLAELRRRGIPLALGTDSLASNPDLSILEEIRFLHRQRPDLNAGWMLYLATLGGARSLGFSDETGSLAPGKFADLVVLPLPDRDDADPHRLVLDSALDVQKVLFRGVWVFHQPEA